MDVLEALKSAANELGREPTLEEAYDLGRQSGPTAAYASVSEGEGLAPNARMMLTLSITPTHQMLQSVRTLAEHSPSCPEGLKAMQELLDLLPLPEAARVTMLGQCTFMAVDPEDLSTDRNEWPREIDTILLRQMLGGGSEVTH